MIKRKLIGRATIVLAALLTTGAVGAQDNSQPYPPAPQQYPQQQPYPPQQQYPQEQAPPPQYPQQSPQQQPSYPPAPYGQYPAAPAPVLSPQQLDQIAAPIALYSDPLLAQVLTAATYYNQIPDAATWAMQHNYLTGAALAQAIQDDRLPFDPSVQALLPFPQVLDYMARNMAWTQALGNAVLAQRPEVMDAVQRRRQQAYDYGYLRSNPYERVEAAAPYDVEIVPVNPGAYYVPVYDPFVVYARPRPGFFVGGAIRFGPAVSLGVSFAPWGWGGVGFGWREHSIVVAGRPWERTWVNQRAYVAPYPIRPHTGPQVEHHEVHEYHAHEEHHGDDHHH
jgi:Protein of unknown function (DUF3300)